MCNNRETITNRLFSDTTLPTIFTFEHTSEHQNTVPPTHQYTEPSLQQDSTNTEKTWFLYVVRCCDQSLYAGITTDIKRRIQEHNASPKGARYTRSRRPVELVISWTYNDRSHASQAEYAFKKLSTKKKKQSIEQNTPPL